MGLELWGNCRFMLNSTKLVISKKEMINISNLKLLKFLDKEQLLKKIKKIKKEMAMYE